MYNTMKILIKYKRKSKEDLLKYADAYLKTKKITSTEHVELVALIEAM